MIYDIIGDVHGQANKLIGLLGKLGYQQHFYEQNDEQNGITTPYYQPPVGHHAVFIGDLIDRGKQEVTTLQIAFAMKDAGVADIVMGNHEYNALAYATKNQIHHTNNANNANNAFNANNIDNHNGRYLRSHSDVHRRQHQAFLAEVPFGSDAHAYWLSRFYELPLWLETPHACFVHACWDTDSMAVLAPLLTNDNRLTPHALQLTGQKNSIQYDALERVLKGVETPLPDGLYLLDKDGGKRHNVRVKWWLDELNNRPIHQIAHAPNFALASIPIDAISPPIEFGLKTDKPVFVGHYWLTGTPKPLSEQVVCVDYSAASKTGHLTCYQFDTDNPLPLSADNFVQYRQD